jgi:taurine dioxygenase
MAAVTFDPLTTNLGAVVSGVNLADDLSTETVQDIRDGLLLHHVLFFRDQSLTPEQQIAFGQRFGELDEHPFVVGRSDHPEVLEVITEPDDVVNFGGGWHIDVTFLEEPDMGSILYAVELPKTGGDTLFSDLHSAYDALSTTMKGLLDGLKCVHSPGATYGEGGLHSKQKGMTTKNAENAFSKVEHPLVRTHPETGRKGLYMNPAFTTGIVGMRADESSALLQFLYKHAAKEIFTCRFRWEQGSVAMWDNRSVMHYALLDYKGQRRHMRRITIKGDRPV